MDVVIFTCMSGYLFQRALGAYQIAHHLRNCGYKVQVIDFTDHFSTEELIQMTEKFINDKTLAIGISTTFYKDEHTNELLPMKPKEDHEEDYFPDNVLHTVTHFKQKFNKLKVIAGGARTDLLKNNPLVDIVINGYAEDQITYHLSKLAKKPPSGELFNIEKLNHKFTEHDLILPNETLPIEISRGCIFRCSFCAFPLNGKAKMDYLRDTELIKEEMIKNYELFGTTNYFFGDDTFNDSTYKLEQLHTMVQTLPFKIKFAAYIRMDLLNAHREQIPLLQEMGLASPFFGIETLNKKSGSAIGKGMNPEKAKEFLVQLEDELWDRKIPIICSFIVGLPYESMDSVENTFNWVKNTRLNAVFFPLVINDKNYFKSDFAKNYKEYGYTLDTNTGYWENEYMNQTVAAEMAERFNSELGKKDNYPSAWFMMALLNHGYSYEELLTTPIKKLSPFRILKQKQKNINLYKRKLLELNYA